VQALWLATAGADDQAAKNLEAHGLVCGISWPATRRCRSRGTGRVGADAIRATSRRGPDRH
jgi:hypothetical protein